ncbi:MAG: molybdopterin cofactor-binding domain-containing protein [Pseudomonadota bacterium]
MRDLGKPIAPSRRDFLAGAGGLTLATFVPLRAKGQSGEAAIIRGGAEAGGFAPNAFIRILPDNAITVLVKHIEFGQGPFTGLATLVAEELDAAWDQMRAEAAPADVTLYANAAFGLQGTGGSTAIANSYTQMRKAGAAARAMLIGAAAKTWGVPAGQVTIEDGVIKHAASGKEGGFGEFADSAANETPPEDPPLKAKKDFKFIGKSVPKLDTSGKTTGEAVFTLDVYRDDMLTAVVAHPPKFGAVPASFDVDAARAVSGVVDVKETPQGVAVYGENTYAALKGRDALNVKWNDAGAERRSTAELTALFRETAQGHGVVADERGDVAAALSGDEAVLEAEFVFPYLAHAPMEPLDAVVEQRDDTVEVWMGSQLQTVDQQTFAGVLGVDPSNVIVNTMLAGGSFGRRAQPASNFAAEAAAVFDASGRSRPVKLVWTREDDIRGGFYRPLTVHKIRGAMGADGALKGWEHTVVSQSLVAGSPFEMLIQDGIDPTMIEGARDLYYKTDNFKISVHTMDVGVPVLWWRSVGHTHTAYAVETFMDELLQRAGLDAVEGRLNLLEGRPREAGVLKRVAELADWGRAPREGAAFGVAVHKSFDTYVAQIAEVSMDGGAPRVHKVWAAVDCGQPVNVNVIEAQIEGGIGYGAGAMLFDEITLAPGGAVEQSNFHDYRSLRINEMPEVEVAVIDSDESPTGIGEPGVPPIAPAIGNAMRRVGGSTPRRLPVTGLSV